VCGIDSTLICGLVKLQNITLMLLRVSDLVCGTDSKLKSGLLVMHNFTVILVRVSVRVWK
jgi:hypothetical protein